MSESSKNSKISVARIETDIFPSTDSTVGNMFEPQVDHNPFYDATQIGSPVDSLVDIDTQETYGVIFQGITNSSTPIVPPLVIPPPSNNAIVTSPVFERVTNPKKLFQEFLRESEAPELFKNYCVLTNQIHKSDQMVWACGAVEDKDLYLEPDEKVVTNFPAAAEFRTLLCHHNDKFQDDIDIKLLEQATELGNKRAKAVIRRSWGRRGMISVNSLNQLLSDFKMIDISKRAHMFMVLKYGRINFPIEGEAKMIRNGCEVLRSEIRNEGDDRDMKPISFFIPHYFSKDFTPTEASYFENSPPPGPNNPGSNKRKLSTEGELLHVVSVNSIQDSNTTPTISHKCTRRKDSVEQL